MASSMYPTFDGKNVVDPEEENLRTAAQLIRGGGVVVAPSDTNLALTLDPWNRAASERAFAIKQRPPTSPLTLFIRHPYEWRDYTVVSESAVPIVERLAEAFWPGPFNIILPRNSKIPDHLVCGGPNVAIGCLSNPTIQKILDYVGRPVAMTSANLSGQADGMLVDVSLAVTQVGDSVDLVVRGKSQGTTLSSTIVAYDNGEFSIQRLGDITAMNIREALGKYASSLKE